MDGGNSAAQAVVSSREGQAIAYRCARAGFGSLDVAQFIGRIAALPNHAEPRWLCWKATRPSASQEAQRRLIDHGRCDQERRRRAEARPR